VSLLLASKGSKKHLLGHISSFECCNFAKKKFGVSLAHIEFFLLWVHSGQVAGNVRFFSKMTFLTPELDTTPHKLVLKSVFSVSQEHSGPFSQSTVIHWAETGKNG
jgi:hypothetical protein